MDEAPVELLHATPAAEVTEATVTVHHERYRKTKATPRECPNAPQDPQLYTGERIIVGKYKDGSDVNIHDQDWIHKTPQ